MYIVVVMVILCATTERVTMQDTLSIIGCSEVKVDFHWSAVRIVSNPSKMFSMELEQYPYGSGTIWDGQNGCRKSGWRSSDQTHSEANLVRKLQRPKSDVEIFKPQSSKKTVPNLKAAHRGEYGQSFGSVWLSRQPWHGFKTTENAFLWVSRQGFLEGFCACEISKLGSTIPNPCIPGLVDTYNNDFF